LFKERSGQLLAHFLAKKIERRCYGNGVGAGRGELQRGKKRRERVAIFVKPLREEEVSSVYLSA